MEAISVDPQYGGSCPSCGGADIRLRGSLEKGITYCVNCAYGFTMPGQYPVDMYSDPACRAHREAKKREAQVVAPGAQDAPREPA